MARCLAHVLHKGSRMGFGCMGITALYGAPMEDEDAVSLLRGVYEAGCRHFDTAEVYKTGDCLDLTNPNDKYNEVQLGKFLQTVPRNSFTVGTKYWPGCHGDECKQDKVKAAVHASLGRLGLEYIDVYYCHRIPSKEACLDFMRSCKSLVEEGLIKHVGLSEVNGSWLQEAHTICSVLCVQQEWSLLTRNLEAELVPVCAELGVCIVAYSPMSRGLLAAPDIKPSDEFRSGFPRFNAQNFAHNTILAQQVKEIASQKNVTTAQLSLAWLFHKAAELKVSVMPIPGTTKIANAKSNLGAVGVKLSTDEMRVLERLASHVAGQRFPEEAMKLAFESQVFDYDMPKTKVRRIDDSHVP